MKKHLFFTFCFLFVSFIALAGKFVLIPVNETNNLETLFNNNNLKIHYYCDDYVLATTDNLNFEGIVTLDEPAFDDVDSYVIVYCFENQKEEYLARIAGSVKTLYSGKNFFIMKIVGEGFSPAKNDGLVAILNTEAKMSKTRFDYPVITESNELIVNLISQVNTETVMSYIQSLENFVSRNAHHANHVAARDWIKQQYEAMGLSVTLHNFNWNYYGSHNNDNVIAIQYGTEFPDEYIVLGGHYDSYTYESQNDAPGADDDASGSAGILETARILSQYDSKRSIIYCAFSAEEYGLYGSGAYAQKCYNEGMNILGYFNLDMTGYLKSGDPIHMSLIYPNGALTLADYFVNVCDIYFPTIPVTRHANLPWGDSDHTSFNNKGYKGIWWFEDINCDSPYIHHIQGNNGCNNPCLGNVPCLGDIIGPSVNNSEQVTVFTQAMVASIATLAEIETSLPPPLNPPTNCLAEYFEEMSIKITWDAPDSPEPDGYDVYRDEIKINEDLWTTTIYTDEVNDNDEHCYKIKAIWGSQQSNFSNESCAAVPFIPLAPPTNCFAEYLEEMSIKVTWEAPEEATPNEYYIYRDNEKIFQNMELYYIDIIADYEEHCYKVTAIYEEKESEFSNESCDKVPVGIIEYNSKYKIYPNPTTGMLQVASDDLQVAGIEIFDAYGRKVSSHHFIASSSHHIDISHLPAGIYFIKISNEMVGRFIKE